MRKIDQRKIQILKLIIEEYIKTGEIMGSKNLLKKYDLRVSPATVRNDMMQLETMGLIFQPYNSAGRLPTTRWIRVFVDYLMDTIPSILIEEESINHPVIRSELIDDILYGIVDRLADITREIVFATVPTDWVLTYLWISNILNTLEEEKLINIRSIITLLESKYMFLSFLEWLSIPDRVAVYLGQDVLPETIKDCVIIAKRVTLQGKICYLGIIGSLKMDYAFNIATLRQTL